ncbi:MAG: alkene reductase [Aquabacterium sp.]|uniref:alkene reductase n=1 Tax=Aquabacterium sp. TaxID=1872578 RepID=UPI0027190BBD|nr:alkene reductase [Aquabacterium sp.]MDO9004123.1 alkene reductase [Aquabacterium sp.]
MPINLFSPLKVGSLDLANRMVMAPMTRNRADQLGVPSPLMATYYAQRAEAGLIISESVPVSSLGIGYPFTPGLFTEAQVLGWRAVTDAVHARHGLIFAQLQHCGRVSHPTLLPDGLSPVAPSALKPSGQAMTYTGPQDFVTPVELDVEEINATVAQFKLAAQFAVAAGFDGVEVHSANGYLIDQFLRDGSNQRSDTYGGSPEARFRFLAEVLNAVTAVWPTHRVGVRLSPENSFNDMHDSDPQKHFGQFAQWLSPLNLAYLHVLEGDMMTQGCKVDYQQMRAAFGGIYMANNGYSKESAQAAIRSGAADLVAFGTPFLANPDLVRRFREDLPLNTPDHASFYGGNDRGYIDYPSHEGPVSP